MRKHKPEEHLNHEAWAIPYADLMTLLLAFFVVMYAVSVVNEGKFRVMSESLVQAFNGSSGVIAPPSVTQGEVNTSAVVSVDRSGAAVSPVALPLPLRPRPVSGAGSRPGAGQQELDNIENQVRRALQPLIDRKLVVVRHQQDWLEIEIRTDILFPSGVAQLSTSADSVLQNLATILARFPNPLRVEGFTDNVPISTPQYPSNWELSAARAASVARLFALSGVAPDRLGIVGWGEVRPLVDNATVEGRNQNRRVLVVVMNTAKNIQRQHSDAANLHEIARVNVPSPATGQLPAVPVDRAASAPVDGATGLPAATPTAPVNARNPGSAVPAPAADELSGLVPRRVSPDR